MRTNSGSGIEDPSRVVLTRNIDDSVVELAIHGRWTRQTGVDVYQALRKCLAEHPAAIIIDLHGMSDLDGRSAPTWIAVSRAAMVLQPPAHVVLCAPPTRQVVTRLRQLGSTRFLSLFVTVEQARATVANRLPLTDLLQLRWLPPHPDSLTAVREMVASACGLWSMTTLSAAAQDVALDLIDDSVTHAKTAMVFAVSRRSSSLYLSLRDHDPTLPPLRPLPAGHGELPAAKRLGVVIARSYVCGASTTHDGKVVWAVIRSRTRPAPGDLPLRPTG